VQVAEEQVPLVLIPLLSAPVHIQVQAAQEQKSISTAHQLTTQVVAVVECMCFPQQE
jgi:hypothetical protein